MGEKKNEYEYDQELVAIRSAHVDVYEEYEEALFAAQKQHAAEQTRKQFKTIRVVPR